MEDGKLTVRAVERALDIMLCFTDSSNLSLTEIAVRVSLHKSTVHRLLASLEGKGFVVRDFATDKYRLGFRIWELSANMTHSDDPAIILLPEMERLRDQLDETISLYVCDGLERVRIQAVESNQAIRRVAAIGARLPLYVGASSKILVAFAEPQVQEALMKAKNMPVGLERSVFLKQLADVLSQGYATSVEERELGAAAVAVPIFNQAHTLVASLAVSGPSNRLTLEKMKEHAPVLLEAARRMGKMVR
ncbi:IclR family transcriptional regulator [Paenibacillus agricola]|uniref:IclR family transcriptional regulator n=1 Tax=Paenibacillus agricola TaxID=2716264 RepID=A0ABX0J826_9BACL|nr:IclR family transcriptional regulator [Paenibacillus agricola]NHN32297.1 IclR family transcriptional regulator [Paenibacillus agricola]